MAGFTTGALRAANFRNAGLMRAYASMAMSFVRGLKQSQQACAETISLNASKRGFYWGTCLSHMPRLTNIKPHISRSESDK